MKLIFSFILGLTSSLYAQDKKITADYRFTSEQNAADKGTYEMKLIDKRIEDKNKNTVGIATGLFNGDARQASVALYNIYLGLGYQFYWPDRIGKDASSIQFSEQALRDQIEKTIIDESEGGTPNKIYILKQALAAAKDFDNVARERNQCRTQLSQKQDCPPCTSQGSPPISGGTTTVPRDSRAR